jgi:hypothetical protein
VSWAGKPKFLALPTDSLMRRLESLRSGLYPTKSHASMIEREMYERVPQGCLIIFGEVRCD